MNHAFDSEAFGSSELTVFLYQRCIRITSTSCQSPDTQREENLDMQQIFFPLKSGVKTIAVKAHFHKRVCRAEGKHEALTAQSGLSILQP